MSVQNIVLYGAILYDPDTYSTNQDPQSFTATLTDTATLADLEIQNATKVAADAISMAEAWIASGKKVLADSAAMGETIAKSLAMATLLESLGLSDARVIASKKALADVIAVADTIVTLNATKAVTEAMTLTEQRLMAAVKILAESLTVSDAKIQLAQIKGLSDFALLKDWIELKLVRAGIWQSTPAFGFKPSNIHLYGPGVFYGVDFYASNPTVAWLVSTPAQTTWEMEPTVGAVLPLYGQTQYGPQPYSATPEASWTKPVSTARQAWTNANGESHN